MIGDPEDLKALLSLPAGTVTDEELLRLLGAASAAVKSYCGRDFELAEYTEYFDAGHRDYVLREYPVHPGDPNADPVIPAPRAWYDPTGYYGAGANAFASSTEWVVGVDFVVIPDGTGILRRLGYGSGGWGWWGGRGYGSAYGCGGYPGGPGAIKVVYTAGYLPDDLPEDLVAEAVAEAAARWAAGVTLASGGGSGSAGGGGSTNSVQLGSFRIAQGATSSASSRTATGAGKATLYGANRGVLDRYRMPVIA